MEELIFLMHIGKETDVCISWKQLPATGYEVSIYKLIKMKVYPLYLFNCLLLPLTSFLFI